MARWEAHTAAVQALLADPASRDRVVQDPHFPSGQYGPRVAVPQDADPQTRLVAFLGRDPGWSPA